MLDSHLSWKTRVSSILKKLKRNIGLICKARHYVNLEILINLYYCLIYLYLVYGILCGVTHINPQYSRSPNYYSKESPSSYHF